MQLLSSALLLLGLPLVSIAQEVISVHGSGTTNPSKCFWHIMSLMEDRIKVPTRLTYRAVGSSTGQAEFIGDDDALTPDNHFGSGDIPITNEDYTKLQNANISIVQLPVMLGAISLFHSVPNVEKLNLNACLIARIFKRKITDWLHEDIVFLNNDLESLIGASTYPIKVAHRVLGSSSTASVTAYLRQGCPTEWPEESVGSSIDWDPNTKACDSSGAMTACIRDDPGTIGYIDAGHGHEEGLTEIELRNADGNFLSSVVAEKNGGIDAAVSGSNTNLPASADGDFSFVELLNQPGEFTWPIVALTYVYVRQDLSAHTDSPEAQALLVAFLNALYDDTYIGLCEDRYGFTAVPSSVRQLALDGLQLLQLDPTAPTFIFENGTEPNIGQGDYVVTDKRRSFNELERTTTKDTVDAILEENTILKDRILELEGTIQKLQTTTTQNSQMIASMGGTTNGATGTDDNLQISSPRFTTNDAHQIDSALIMSAISMVLWAIAIILGVSRFVSKK